LSELVRELLRALNLGALAYMLLLNSSYLVTILLAVRPLRRYARRAERENVNDVLTSGAPPISILAPAYNESAVCVEATQALLSLVYPEYEVIVINDGSTDDTLAKLTQAFDLEPAARAPTASVPSKPVKAVYHSRRRPNLWVIDKENGGSKADALNAGIAYCQTELFCAIDADTLLDRDALGRIVRPFLEDERTVAAGGTIRIVNGTTVRLGIVEQVRLPRSFLARMQVLEYLRAFLVGRVGWDRIDCLLIISGAFGLFRRSLVVEIGGYKTDSLGEDMDLVVRIHRRCRDRKMPYRVTFAPDPVAWTEAPERARVLEGQRNRWQRGLLQVLWRERAMMLNPRYGRIGMFAFPYFWLAEGLSPLIELVGYASFVVSFLLGAVSPLYALALFTLSFLFGAALSFAAVGLEELTFRRYERWGDLVRLMGLALVEPFGYHQMNLWWRLKGLWSAITGDTRWGAMERRGFQLAEGPRP
jgi:cellulose synthase/poly-beta-1,6-N-acetylglucosamine synthase-like glycosyltransferase